MQEQDRYWQAKKVTLIGAFINALLGVIKLIGGVVFHSHALAADGIHSFSDLLTDGMVIFAAKYGSQDADSAHPYGHQRIETAATLLLALILILAGAGIAWDAVVEIIHHTHDMPDWLTLPIAALSVVANEGLFHYTQSVGKRIRSALLIANAWHHRSDAASSIVVLVGLLGNFAGVVYFDALAAVVVGAMIIQMGLRYGWSSVKELIDTGVDPHLITPIRDAILQVDGVQKIHQLRTRLMGRDIFIDVHILVSPYLSVSEGHFIAQNVHLSLVNGIEHVKDVTVHVDPEDDEVLSPSIQLPTRETLESTLLYPWQKAYPDLHSWTLYYLDGVVAVDLFVSSGFQDWASLTQRIEADRTDQPLISKVRLYVAHSEITLAKSSV